MILIEREKQDVYVRERQYQRLEFYGLQTARFPQTFVYTLPFEPFYRLVFVRKGVCTLRAQEKEYPLQKNDCLLLPRFTAYTFCASAETELLVAEFHLEGELPLREQGISLFSGAIEAKDLFSRLCNTARASDGNGVEEAIVWLLLDTLKMRSCGNGKKWELYLEICEWAEENARRAATVEELAERLQYTPEHLNRIVKEFGETTVSGLLIKRRVEMIEFFAETGNYTIAEIAKALEFFSPELLRKYYRYHTGESLSKRLREKKEV